MTDGLWVQGSSARQLPAMPPPRVSQFTNAGVREGGPGTRGGEREGMQQTLAHRIRIFLHLLKVRENMKPTAPEAWIVTLLMGVLEAQERRDHGDWLGYETALFRVAAGVLGALEHHHRSTDSHQLPKRSGATGREVLPVEPFLPDLDWITEGMEALAGYTYPHQSVTWPGMDGEQRARLKALFDGLMGAFFEQEGAQPILER